VTVHGGDTCDFSIGCNPYCASVDCSNPCPQGSLCNGGTTPRDLAAIWRHASAENSLFLTAAGARTYTINSNLTTYPLTKGFGYYPAVDGDKNGLSSGSKNSQIAQATRAGRSLIAVVQQSQVDYDANGNVAKLYAFGDIGDLFRYGFARLFSPDRRGDSGTQGGAIKDHALDCTFGSSAVSAIRTNADTLRLVLWDVDADAGAVASVATYALPAAGKGARTFAKGHVHEVDVAFMLPAFFVTATVEGGAVKLRSWNATKTIFNEPKINALQLTGAGGGDGVRLLVLNDNNLVLLVVRGPDGRLRLSTWSVAFDGTFTQLGDSGPAGDEVTDFSVAATLLSARGSVYRVTTASLTASGWMRLDNWTVAGVTGSVSFVHGQKVLSGATHPSVFLPSPTLAVTASEAPVVGLEIDEWGMFSDGTFTGGGDSSNGVDLGDAMETNVLPMGPISASPTSVLVAARTVSQSRTGLVHNVRLFAWEWPKAIAEAPFVYDLLGQSGGVEGDGTELDTCLLDQLHSAGEYVTAFRTPAGSLKLSVWQVARQP
jgi:hypothetical protein